MEDLRRLSARPRLRLRSRHIRQGLAWLVFAGTLGPACRGAAPGQTETAADASDLVDAKGVDTDVLAQVDQGTSGVGLACALTAVELLGSDQYPGPHTPPLCTADDCWMVAGSLPPSSSDADLMMYFDYSQFLMVYRWHMAKNTLESWTVQPAIMGVSGYRPAAAAVVGDDLLVTGGDATNPTSPLNKFSSFTCTLDLPAVATCTQSANPTNPSLFVQTAGGQLVVASSHFIAATPTSLSVLTLAAGQVENGALALAPPNEIEWGVHDFVSSALPVGEDLVVASSDRGWCGRVTLAGKVVWQYLDPPPGSAAKMTNSYHAIVAADTTRVLLSRKRWNGSDYSNDMLALSSVSGQILWQRPLGVGTTVNGRGRPVGGSWYQRWPSVFANDSMLGHTLEWLDLNTGRTVGIRAGLVEPTGTVIRTLGPGPTPLTTAYIGVHKPSAANPVKTEEGVNIAGLADTWGNTTCESSGNCWQKTYADCADSNPCTSDLCDAAHGGCYHVPLPDGITCSDSGGHCAAGTCK